MSTSLKYGCITPNAKGRAYPVAASQYFPFASGHFVLLDSSGHVRLALTADTTVFGWAVTPASVGAGAAGSAYWKSSATAGADKVFVITDLEAEFCLPADDTVTDAMVGDGCDFIGVNDGTIQQVDVGTGTNDVLIVVKKAQDRIENAAATDAIVRMNPSKLQIASS